jgi:hypothetical protein
LWEIFAMLRSLGRTGRGIVSEEFPELGDYDTCESFYIRLRIRLESGRRV